MADSIVGFHLRTMARLGIAYDLLARESEILHLHFWDAAFEKLKEAKGKPARAAAPQVMKTEIPRKRHLKRQSLMRTVIP